MNDFGRKLLQEYEQRKLYEMAMRQGAKEFADKLNEAREKDAREFFEQAVAAISGLSNEATLCTLCMLACDKLQDVGYREFADLFKLALRRSKK